MLGKQELNPHDPADARAFLEQDERTLKRKVKNVAAENSDAAAAIFTVCKGERFEWTPEDWQMVLDRIDECELTVREWLANADVQ